MKVLFEMFGQNQAIKVEIVDLVSPFIYIQDNIVSHKS